MKPLPFAILTFMLAAWGIFAVHQRVLATRNGYMVQHLQEERRLLLEDRAKLNGEISALIRPDRIADEVRRMGLDLVDPVTSTSPEPARRPGVQAVGTGRNMTQKPRR